jgi:hypothetical protein
MTKKWALSKCNAIISRKDGYVTGMSSIVVEPKRNKRMGHACTMYMCTFDYDRFIRDGYAISPGGDYVFKLNKRLNPTVSRVLGDNGFRKFVSSVLSRTAWDDALDMNTQKMPSEVIRLFSTVMQVSKMELNRIQSEADGRDSGIARLLDFKIAF